MYIPIFFQELKLPCLVLPPPLSYTIVDDFNTTKFEKRKIFQLIKMKSEHAFAIVYISRKASACETLSFSRSQAHHGTIFDQTSKVTDSRRASDRYPGRS